MPKLPLTAKDILDSDGKYPERRKAATDEQRENAAILAARVNAMFLQMGMDERPVINEGLREQNAKYGAKRSWHKRGGAVDFRDSNRKLSSAITKALLLKFKLRREDNDYTPTWTHIDIGEPHGVIFKP